MLQSVVLAQQQPPQQSVPQTQPHDTPPDNNNRMEGRQMSCRQQPAPPPPMQQRCHHTSVLARSPFWPTMPRPRLQRAATARPEKIQPPIVEQNFSKDDQLHVKCLSQGAWSDFLIFSWMRDPCGSNGSCTRIKPTTLRLAKNSSCCSQWLIQGWTDDQLHVKLLSQGSWSDFRHILLDEGPMWIKLLLYQHQAYHVETSEELKLLLVVEDPGVDVLTGSLADLRNDVGHFNRNCPHELRRAEATLCTDWRGAGSERGLARRS
jgi:hypothetical protein